jgi:hypothetical protein
MYRDGVGSQTGRQVKALWALVIFIFFPNPKPKPNPKVLDILKLPMYFDKISDIRGVLHQVERAWGGVILLQLPECFAYFLLFAN